MMRKFINGDLEAVVAIFRSNIPKYFSPAEEAGLRDFLANCSDYYVAEKDAVIIAAGGIAKNSDDTVSLCWGMVRNDLIGTGVGKKLTEFRIALSSKKFGDLPLTICTSQHTKGFYESLGFRVTEQIVDGFGPGIDNCKMRLEPINFPDLRVQEESPV